MSWKEQYISDLYGCCVEYNVTKHKNIYAVCQQRQKEKKTPARVSVNSGLKKHEGICSDPWKTELNLQEKS